MFQISFQTGNYCNVAFAICDFASCTGVKKSV